MQEEKAKVYHNEEASEEDIVVGDDGYKMHLKEFQVKRERLRKVIGSSMMMAMSFLKDL